MDPHVLEAVWPLTGAVVGDRLLSGADRKVMKVHADQGLFVARVNSRARPDVGDPDQLYVLDYLRQRRFAHVPNLLRTRTGERTARLRGDLVSVLEYVPAALDGGGRVGAWEQLGQAAARLNRHRGYPIPFAIPVGSALDELARRAAGRRFEARLLELLARVAELERLPTDALVHGEINDANARRRADGSVVLLDWDEAGAAAPAVELGYPLITNFLSEEDLTFDHSSACAFYRSYVESGGAIEPRQLFNAALFHALRYMWWGNVDQRWERVIYSVDREAELCSVLP